MTSRKPKSINRDEIELGINVYYEIFEIKYNEKIYDVWVDKLNTWGFTPMNNFSKFTTHIKSEIDKLIYSDVIDSFIEWCKTDD